MDISSQKTARIGEGRYKGVANQPKNRSHHAERVKREAHAMPPHASRQNQAASQVWKRSALRWPMQCAAMADAARCVGRCTALHFPPHLDGSAVTNCRKAPCSPLYIKKTARWNPPRSTFHLSLFTLHLHRGTLMASSGHRPPPVPATPWRYGAQHAACPR